MRTSRHECKPHISKRSADKHAQMRFLGKMRHYQTLPIAREHILTDARTDMHAAAGLPRLNENVSLSVMAQRLEMPHAFHCRGHGLFVENPAGAKIHVDAEALMQRLADHVKLHLAHQLHVQFLQTLHPCDAQQRLLVLQFAQRRDELVQGVFIELQAARPRCDAVRCAGLGVCDVGRSSCWGIGRIIASLILGAVSGICAR